MTDENESTVDINTVKALDHEDLNECVSSLFRKSKDTTSEEARKKKRQRKNLCQVKVLKNQYTKNPDWSRDVIRKLSEELGLSECQIYKWRWDHLKKSGLEEDQSHALF